MEAPRTDLRGPQFYLNNNEDNSVSVSPSTQSVAQSVSEGSAGVPQDYALAFIWFHKAVVQGDKDSQFSLGYMYKHGNGASMNHAKAKEWFLKAAQQGHAAAKERLEEMEEMEEVEKSWEGTWR